MNDFIQFASSHGLVIDTLSFSRIVRCATESKPNKKNGAYFYAGDFGWIQDHAAHESPVIWFSGSIKDHGQAKQKIKESTAKYYQDRARINAEAAKKAQWILSQCELNFHPYLAKKGFPEMSANVWQKDDESILVIPMYKDDSIVGCQMINAEGNKKFLYGQSSQDAYFQIGNGNSVFFVEGYASGLSLHVILQSLKINHTIYVTFSASNLGRFAKCMDGFVIADNDQSGVGEKVALDSGKRFWMPPVIGFDINDYHVKFGVFKVAQEIKRLIYSKP